MKRSLGSEVRSPAGLAHLVIVGLARRALVRALLVLAVAARHAGAYPERERFLNLRMVRVLMVLHG